MLQQISQEGLLEILLDVKGTTFATIRTDVEVKQPKSSPMFGKLRKETIVNVTLGFNYTNSVNSQRVKEGNEETFVAQERKWGKRIQGTPVVSHEKDGLFNFYLEAKINGKSQSTKYFVDGVEVPKETILQFLPKVKPSNTQDLEKEVILRDYKLDSIKEIKIKGTEYLVF